MSYFNLYLTEDGSARDLVIAADTVLLSGDVAGGANSSDFTAMSLDSRRPQPRNCGKSTEPRSMNYY